MKPSNNKGRPESGAEIGLLREISSKLDRLIAVTAAQGKDRDKQIAILSAAGCDSALIGAVVGLQPGAVRTYLSRRRPKGDDKNSSDQGA